MLDNLKKYKVVLASASPRRRELLAGLDVEFEVRALPDAQKPTACIACRACEDVCPQNIKISEMMAELAKRTC